MEDVDGRRDEEDIGDEGKVVSEDGEDQAIQVDEAAEAAAAADDTAPKRRYITTAREVHDAFDSVNTLRYSQPTHLQGQSCFLFYSLCLTDVPKGNARD